MAIRLRTTTGDETLNIPDGKEEKLKVFWERDKQRRIDQVNAKLEEELPQAAVDQLNAALVTIGEETHLNYLVRSAKNGIFLTEKMHREGVLQKQAQQLVNAGIQELNDEIGGL